MIKIIDKSKRNGLAGKLFHVLQRILYEDISITKIYIYIDKEADLRGRQHVFSEMKGTPDKEILFLFPVSFTYHRRLNVQNIFKDKNFQKASKLCQMIQFKKSILEKGDKLAESKIRDNTLGVHIRFTDMNRVHPKHGIHNIQNYIDKIDHVLATEKVSNIFVASDNMESINKLIKRYPRLTIDYLDLKTRLPLETSDNRRNLNDNANKAEFFEEVVLEILLLSKVKHIVYRTSNFANIAILYSKTIEKYFKL